MLNHLTPSERLAIDKFNQGVADILGDELFEARLFGSRARGEGHEHSDLDIALIVTAEGRRRRHQVYDLAFDISLEHRVQLAPMVIEKERLEELRRRERLIAAELDRDGIPL